MICELGSIRIREAATMLDVAPLAIADTFVNAIIKLELDHARDLVARLGRRAISSIPMGEQTPRSRMSSFHTTCLRTTPSSLRNRSPRTRPI
jgi:hypothetical protein